MHWGLTAFERKRIERIALDHPYFDMHAQLLTKKELRTILAQDPCKTGPQVVAEVKKELGIAYAPITQKKRTFAEALRDASFVPSFRRTVVLGVLSLLLVLFMTLTVPGRTFAEEVYTIIIRVINNSIKAQHYSSSDIEPEVSWDFLSLPSDIGSPQLLSDRIKRSLVVSSDKQVSFKYTPIDDDYLIIRTGHEDETGKTYVISQEIISPDNVWGYEIEYQEDAIVIPTGIKIQMYGSITNDDTKVLVGFVDQRPSQSLCKPPNRCRIRASEWRFTIYGKEKRKTQKSGGSSSAGKDKGVAGDSRSKRHG